MTTAWSRSFALTRPSATPPRSSATTGGRHATAIGQSTTLDNISGAQLFAPYGGVRYSSGLMPPSYGFTGQRSDAATGLDYYGARYYDPLAGQFTSADSVVPGDGFDLWGLSRYAYVGGNPIARTDPTGHDGFDPGGGGGCSPGDPACGGPPPAPPDPCADGGCNTPPTGAPPSAGPIPSGPSVDPGSGGGGSLGLTFVTAQQWQPGPDVRFISPTCAQVNGANLGVCQPMGWNLNPTPDYSLCIGRGLCDSWDSTAISSGSFSFTNGGGDPEMSADQAAQDESRTGRQPMTQDTIDRVANKYGVDTEGVTRINLRKDISGGYRGEVKPDGSIDLTRSAFDSEAELAKTLKEETFHLSQIAERGWPATRQDVAAYEAEAKAHVAAWWASHPLGGW